jgi:SAM-dependent methyltransferase
MVEGSGAGCLNPQASPSRSYTDPRLAAVYDALNPPEADALFYLRLAGDEPKTILDMGCGTGRLACSLARRGHRVTGADPASAMLDIARKRQGGDKVAWIAAGAADLSIDTRFDLIIMTGHVFQVFLDDMAVAAVLANLSRHLAPEGRLAFETRNPLVEEWRDWTPERTRERIDVPGLGAVDVHYRVSGVAGQLVTFETHFRFAEDDVVTTWNTLRFMGKDELAAALERSGAPDVTWFGDWDGSPIGPARPELIVIATFERPQDGPTAAFC